MIVAPIRPVEPVPADGLVEAVEQLLADVKAGHVRELAYAARRTGDEIQTCVAGEGDDLFRMVGALRGLEHRLLQGVMP